MGARLGRIRPLQMSLTIMQCVQCPGNIYIYIYLGFSHIFKGGNPNPRRNRKGRCARIASKASLARSGVFQGRPQPALWATRICACRIFPAQPESGRELNPEDSKFQQQANCILGDTPTTSPKARTKGQGRGEVPKRDCPGKQRQLERKRFPLMYVALKALNSLLHPLHE